MRSGGFTSAGRDFAAETMELRSATNPWHAPHVARCSRASFESCSSPSTSRTDSNSLQCIQGTPEGEALGGCPWKLIPRILCTGCLECFLHSNLIQRTRRSFCGLAFLARLLPHFLLQQLAKPGARFMQLRLRISDGASHDVRNLVVFVALHVVQDEHGPVAWRELFNGALQVHAIDGSGKPQIGGADIPLVAAVFGVGFRGLFERIGGERFLSQTHENHVDGHAMQPGGKGRFTAKGANLAEKLKESLLHQIFRIGGIPNHSQTQSVNPAPMELVKEFKSRSIPRLSQTDSLCFGPRYRLCWSLTGQLSSCGATTSTDAPSRS